MSSAESEVIKTLYKSWVDTMHANPDLSLEDTRKMFEHWGDITSEPGGVDYVEVSANGISCLWAIPHNVDKNRALLCTHGGGYMVGSMYSHRKMFGHIAKEIGCPALIVNYKLAPENVHPGPVNDCVTAYKWLLDQGVLPENIVFVGDSAGGALAITTLLAARDQGLPLPAASLPISPWVDMEITGDTVNSNEEKDFFVKRSVIETMSAAFLGEGGDRQDPLANPLYADLKGLPPLYIQVGGDEALLDDSRNIAKRAKEAGVEVKIDVFPEMQHVFHFLAGTAPEADEAIQKMAVWARGKLKME